MKPALRVVPTAPALTVGVAATDEVLAAAIGSWLRREVTQDEFVVQRMTHMAMSVRAEGATVDETCAWATGLARSWQCHPSNMPSRAHLRLVAAS